MAGGVLPPMIPAISTGPVNMSHVTERLIQCPYEQAHSILAYRMQVHLHKCRKNHPSADWGYCRHDSTHHMPRQELQWHEDNECPSRHNFQAMIVQFEDSGPRVPIDHIALPKCEENWDDEPVNVFDPKENAKAKSLIRGVHCVPPSERKQFRAEHRKHVESNDEIETKAKLNNAQPRKPQTKDDGQMEPLRAPRQLPRGFTMGRGVNRSNGETAVPQSSSSSSSSSASQSVEQVTERLANMQWMGMGRGRPIPPQEPTAPNGARGFERPNTPPESFSPPKGAWGNGRPNF